MVVQGTPGAVLNTRCAGAGRNTRGARRGTRGRGRGGARDGAQERAVDTGWSRWDGVSQPQIPPFTGM